MKISPALGVACAQQRFASGWNNTLNGLHLDPKGASMRPEKSGR